jgi:DNA-directed RNA polymerase specialized sigma24 family protein
MKDFIYEEVLRKYFPKKEIRSEFEQEIWLYLLENPDKTLEVYNAKYFKYYFISIVKRQVISNSSNWHVNFRKPNMDITDTILEQGEEYNPLETEEQQIKLLDKETKLQLVEDALNHFQQRDKEFKVSADFFRCHYYEGMSIRQISKKFFNTPPTTVFENIHKASTLIKHYYRKYKKNYPGLDLEGTYLN